MGMELIWYKLLTVNQKRVGSSPTFPAYWDVSPLSDKQLKEQLVTGEFNSHHPNIGQEE